MPRNVGPVTIVIFSACAIAFTSVALNANWWTTQAEIMSSTNSSLLVGTSSSTNFYLLKLHHYSGFTGAQTTIKYSQLSEMERSDLNAIRGINIALISVACVLFVYGLSVASHPEKTLHVAKLFKVLASAGFALSLANLLVLTDVPDQITASINNALSAAGTDYSIPQFTCGSTSFTIGSYTFQGSTVNCGDIWKTQQWALIGTDSSTALLQTSTRAGSGWWWTFGAMFAFLGVVFGTHLASKMSRKQMRQASDASDVQIDA
eukprot:TRINITY_DN22126_c0_g1_i1.p1 TRINITY_DN22126_c0_g1~~TRINITY_DN22126_c0_g1_i1.p1  ORF type:complete len:262 (-),score=71.32 TRINITY_DN22126_c0_g1_i1:127-912(-)